MKFPEENKTPRATLPPVSGAPRSPDPAEDLPGTKLESRTEMAACHDFSLEDRFVWRTEEERRLLDKALEGALDEDIDLCPPEGQPVRCHRSVLSAASPFFGAMFKSGMRECQGKVKLQFSQETLQSLVRFLYTGRFEVTESNFEQTFLMVHLFELRSALAVMTDLLSDSAERENALELYDTATSFNIPKLRTSVTKFLLAVPILEMQFDQFPLDLLASLLDSDELRVDHEGQIVELILSWVKADPTTRAVHQNALLRYVRIPHLRLIEVNAWREELDGLELFAVLTDSSDWLADVDKKMLTKRSHTDVHLHTFWAEDSLCEYSFEMMRQRKVDQPLWMFDTSKYSMACSFLGKGPGVEVDCCTSDYLSCVSLDCLLVREDWTKRPCFVFGADLHISLHDTLRRVADIKGDWTSPDYDLAFVKVPVAANGLTNWRGQCKRRTFNFDYFKTRICCATEYRGEIVFVMGAFTDTDNGPEPFVIRICRFNPTVEAHYDDEVECLTYEQELLKEYVPIACVATANDKLAVLSAHDIKVFDLIDTTTTLNLECSISLEFEIGVAAWVKENTLYVYLVDRLKDVVGDGADDEGAEEPPKKHFISGYSVTNNFDKIFQHQLAFPELSSTQIGYPKDVRAHIIRDSVYIIYKALPKYKSPADEGIYIYRYDENSRDLVRVDRFEVLRYGTSDRFPTVGVVYERDFVTFLPTDMIPCEHTTLLEEFCRRCSLDEELGYDSQKLASLRKFLL